MFFFFCSPSSMGICNELPNSGVKTARLFSTTWTNGIIWKTFRIIPSNFKLLLYNHILSFVRPGNKLFSIQSCYFIFTNSLTLLNLTYPPDHDIYAANTSLSVGLVLPCMNIVKILETSSYIKNLLCYIHKFRKNI